MFSYMNTTRIKKSVEISAENVKVLMNFPSILYSFKHASPTSIISFSSKLKLDGEATDTQRNQIMNLIMNLLRQWAAKNWREELSATDEHANKDLVLQFYNTSLHWATNNKRYHISFDGEEYMFKCTPQTKISVSRKGAEACEKVHLQKQDHDIVAVYNKDEFVYSFLTDKIKMKIKGEKEQKSKYTWEFKKSVGDNLPKDIISNKKDPKWNLFTDPDEWLTYETEYQQIKAVFKKLRMDLEQNHPGEFEKINEIQGKVSFVNLR